MKRLVSTVALVALPLGAVPALGGVGSSARCPAPKTCALYALEPWHLNSDRAGHIVVHYRVNPVQPWLSEAVAIRVWAVAARIWHRADPRISFVYDGTTTRAPLVNNLSDAATDDGATLGAVTGSPVDVFGFLPGRAMGWLGDTQVTYDPSGEELQADIAIDDEAPPLYDPCAQRDGACTPAPPSPLVTGSGLNTRPGQRPLGTQDLISLIVHEMGHLLGLAHPPYPDTLAVEETMSPGTYWKDQSLRFRETLGLGDVLGIRHLYPCAPECGRPQVFAP